MLVGVQNLNNYRSPWVVSLLTWGISWALKLVSVVCPSLDYDLSTHHLL